MGLSHKINSPTIMSIVVVGGLLKSHEKLHSRQTVDSEWAQNPVVSCDSMCSIQVNEALR
jgi:hypothetical protein